MWEDNPFEIDGFECDVLRVYIKHGYGEFKLYETTFFSRQIADDTIDMTLNEFYKRAVDCNGVLWRNKPIRYI